MKPFLIVRLTLASFFLAGMVTVSYSYADDGSNYVNVYSCRDVENGIMITREAGQTEGFLSNGIRDAGHGLRDYFLKCVAKDRYYVEWKEIAPEKKEPAPVSASALPDFIVKDILQAPNQDVPNYGDVLTIRVKNVGLGDAPQDSVTVYIWIDDQLEWTYSSSTLSHKDFLKAGGMSDIQPQILRGKHRVKSCVDYNNYFSESNESNNCMEVTLVGPEATSPTSTPTSTPPLGMSCGNSEGGDGLYSACVGDSITHDPTGIVAKVVSYDENLVEVTLSNSTAIRAWLYKNQPNRIYDPTNSKSADFTYTRKTDKHGPFIQITSVQSTTIPTPAPTSSCQDTDGGEKPDIQGKVFLPGEGTLTNYDSNHLFKDTPQGRTWYDTCMIDIDQSSAISWIKADNNQCSGGDCYVIEYACTGRPNDVGKYIKCPNGCSNGACLVGQSQPTDQFPNYSFSVTLTSYPRSTNGSTHENGYLAVKVGDKIQFNWLMKQKGIVNTALKWIWDENVLDCNPSPHFDSPDFLCKVISETGGSVVYLKTSGETQEGKSLEGESNMIKVYTESQSTAPLPAMPKRPTPAPTAKIPLPTFDTGVSPAGYEDEVVTAKATRNPFSDTDLNTLVGQAAANLHALGIIGGYPDGTFKSDRRVNRAEAAKFLLLSRYSNSALQDVHNEGKFWDVLDGQWYTRFIINAYVKGLMSGYPDGSMGPDKNVNTVEFLKMLSLNFALPLDLPYSYQDVPRDSWFAPYAGIAQQYNLFPERKGNLNPGSELTRAEVAVALYQYLSKH